MDSGPLLPADARPAVVTMECQRGVIGDLALFPALAEAAGAHETVATLDRLLVAARGVGVPVVHALFAFDAPPQPAALRSPLMQTAARTPIMAGTPAAELADGLREDPADLRATRSSGVSPFIGTDLDVRLRTLAVDTLIVCGASLNVGIPGTCIEAVNLGYRVIVPTDAVVGVPDGYCRDMLRFTVAQLATLCTVDDLAGGWGAVGE